MNKRQCEIMEILLGERRFVTASELAVRLAVSRKTIYRDMQEIGDHCTDYRLTKKENNGYLLVELAENRIASSDQFEHPDERRLDLLLFLLSIAPCKTSIQKISERYFVSQSSILNDFKHIEKKLAPFGIRLSRTNEGTFISGDQFSLYRLMAVIIESYLTQIGDPFCQYDIPDSIKDIQVKNGRLAEIKSILHEFQEEEDLLLDQPYYLTLFCSLLSIIEKQAHNLQLFPNEEIIYEQIDDSSAVYPMANALAEKLEKQFSFQLKHYEMLNLYYILKAYKLNSRFLLNQQSEVLLNNQVIALADQLIARVSKNSGYRFTEDKELKERLTMHLHSMVYRLNHQIYIINPILKSIKTNFSNIFQLVRFSANELKEDNIYDKHLTDEEIGYITLYFQISYDDRFVNQIPILIECTSGVGTSHLLSEKIRKNFPNIHINKIVAQERIKQSDYNDVELVISTVKTHSIIDKPTILVSPILNEDDKYKIDQFIKDYYKNQVIIYDR